MASIARERQQRAKAERHVRGVPDFDAGGVEQHRQTHAAIFGGTGDRVPAAGRPLPVGLGKARRGHHPARVELRAVLVANPVQGR